MKDKFYIPFLVFLLRAGLFLLRPILPADVVNDGEETLRLYDEKQRQA